MASTYSDRLRIELIGTGEQSGTWGNTTNTNLGTLIDEAIAGVASISMTDANYTLTTANGATDQARQAVIVLTGTLSAARDVICPSKQKVYIVKNSTTGGHAITFKTSGGTGVSVPNGSTLILYCDGTNVESGGTYQPSDSDLTALAALSTTGLVNRTGAATFATVTAPTGTVVGTTDAQTLTNKRYQPRVSATASASSVTPDVGSFDMYIFTALAAGLTINATTSGSPTNGDRLIFRIKDNGTPRALTWTTVGSNSFRAIGVTLPTTTVANKVTYVGCIYNSDESFWDVVAVTTQA